MKYYLKKSWRLITFVCFLLTVDYSLITLLQIVTMQVTSAVIDLNLRSVFYWLAVSFFIGVAIYICDIIATIFTAKAKQQMNNNVRYDLYLTLLKKSHAEYSGQDTGVYQSWLTTNVKQIDQLAWDPFFNSVSSIVTILTCTLTLAWLHWSLLLFGLGSAALMLLLPKVFKKRMEKRGAECAAVESASMVTIRDLLRGLPVLSAFGRNRRFLDEGDKASQNIEDAAYRKQFTQAGFSAINGFVDITIQLANEALAVILAFQGKIIMGAFSNSSNLTVSITRSLTSISKARLSFSSAKAYFEPITVHDGKLKPFEHPASSVKKSITLDQVSFSYGDKPVLQNTSLRFEKGKKYALTGPSGCGKSTVLKLILGWLPGYTGEIRIDGENARAFTSEQLLGSMSYIEQDVFLFNSTIRENITLGGDFTDAQMEKALQNSALAGDLAAMPEGLDTPVGEDGSNLSGGQKQRVAIARALIHDRSVLLVDEGTSALDQENADIVEKSLLDNPDLTRILVSHHLSDERKKQFDKVYTLEPAVPLAV